MNKLIAFYIFISLAFNILPQSKNDISKEDLLSTVKILTSKNFDGRLSGSEGYNKAADFAANIFSELKLKPAGDEKYFQYLNVEYNKIDSPAVFKVIVDNEITEYELGKDFVLRGFTGSNNFILPVALCGYGISKPEIGYDDYAGIDVRNKIVVVFKYNPAWKINETDWGTNYPREKSLTAKKFGAKGILFVSLPNDKNPQPLIGSVLHGDGEQPIDFPQLHISLNAADKLLQLKNISIKEYQTKIDEQQNPFSINLDTEAEIKVAAHYEKNAKTMNVVGIIEGSDPVLKDDFVIVGAHLDHVGSQAGLLFPGANDNASGSAGVLEIAKTFIKNNVQPKRSVLFVLFASEEQGLFGAKHFVDSWKLPYDKITAMLNLDCVGYGDSIQIGNGKSAPALWEIAKHLDKENYNMMVERTWNGGGADATPFHEKNIPCLYFVTTNSYANLHLPSDTTETLNPELYKKIVGLAYQTALEISNGNYIREVVAK
jgi:hypothetical protein